MATFTCRVVSAREDLYSGDISVLVASGIDGELGILAGHTPIITLLKPGPLYLKSAAGTDQVIYVQGGVWGVQPKVVTVLADAAERASNLDEAKIAEARRNAERALANQSANIDTTAALTALPESLAQLQPIQKYKNRA